MVLYAHPQRTAVKYELIHALMCRAYGAYLLIVRCFLVCQSADSLAAFVARLPKPEPTLVDTAFIIASAGYHEEAYTCTRLCQETYTDERLLEPLVRCTFKKGKRTLLMAAVRSGNAERVSQLLQCGAPINAEMPWGYRGTERRSPLQEACRKGHEAVAQLLIDRGADTDCEGLLRFACEGGLTSIVQLLIEKDAASAQKVTNDQMLHFACDGGGSESLVRWLIERGANANAKSTRFLLSGYTPLEVLADRQFRLPPKPSNVALARLLIEKGADIKPNSWADGRTLLHMTGDVDLARLFIENGCDVNARDKDGESPLDNAVFYGREHILRLLVAHGADVNATTEDESTPLQRACKWAQENIARFLIEKGASPAELTSDGCTLLHQLCDQEFWDKGSKEENRASSSPRWFASDFDDANAASDWSPTTKDRAALARLLLDRGVNVNARDSNKRTPLHLILDEKYAHEGSEAIARLLIERGADIKTCDYFGSSVLHIAASRGHEYAVRLLSEVKGGVDARDAQQCTPLHRACEVGSESFARFLLKLGANVNARDESGRTPLHACSEKSTSIRLGPLLITHGADVHARNAGGLQPLDLLRDTVRRFENGESEESESEDSDDAERWQ